MTILGSGNKEIKIDCNSSGIKKQEIITKDYEYVVKLPEITCNNEEDAKEIETKVTVFIRTLLKDILYKK